MDSKHRHELEQNDLVVFLTHFNEWWNKYGQMTLIVIVIALGSFTAARFYNYNKHQAHESAWGGLAQSTSPEGYRATASENSGSVKALAYLRGADLLLTQATLPQTKAEDVVTTPDNTEATDTEKTDDDSVVTPNKVELAAPQVQDPKVMLEDARKMYQAVAEDKNVHVVLQINGLLGLASVAEAQGEWDAAAAAYDQAITKAGATYAVLAQQATGRKAKLNELKKPVLFAKALPKPAPKAVEAPKEEFKVPSLDLNLSNPTLPAITDEDKSEN